VDDAERLYRRVREVMEDSVAKHMRADVTVGSFLSGGIDSTAIAALAKRHNPDLITFTTGFQRAGYSEVDVAAESAAAIGVRHVVKTVSPQEMMDTLPLIVWYLDDPVADPALVPLYFVAREARKHVKVVLSGEGADELFGGYNIYREPLSLRALTSLPGGVRHALGAVGRRLPEGVRGKDLLRRGSIPLEERYYGNARIFRDDELGFLRTRDPSVSFRDVTDPLYARIAGADDVTRMQYVDLFTWLRGDILVKADKMTMANSLELRVPFLDPEVFRVASTLPIDARVTREQTKVALRRALAEVVPPHVLDRRKLGFPVPIRHWLKDEMYDWARDVIEASGTEYLLDRAAVLRMLDDHRAGPHDYSRKLWTLLVFMIWHGIFVERRITPEIPAGVDGQAGRWAATSSAAAGPYTSPSLAVNSAGTTAYSCGPSASSTSVASVAPTCADRCGPRPQEVAPRNPERNPSPTPVGSTISRGGTTGISSGAAPWDSIRMPSAPWVVTLVRTRLSTSASLQPVFCSSSAFS